MEREQRIELLDRGWYYVFGHTYRECLLLSKIDGDIGKQHKGHIDFVMSHPLESISDEELIQRAEVLFPRSGTIFPLDTD